MDIQSVVTKLSGHVIWHHEVTSTNEVAKSMQQLKSYPEGTMVAAMYQTAGKGQAAQTWQSQAGKNILCTLMLNPAFIDIADQVYLNMAVSLSVVDLLHKLGVDAKIKWPNDIYVNHKKIAGLLIENQLQGTAIKSSLVGLGLNVNQTAFINLPYAISLTQVTQITYNLNNLLVEWLSCFTPWYTKLKLKQFQSINHQYHSYLMGINVNQTFVDEHGEFVGQIKKVNQHGQLVVSTPSGLQSYQVKQIKWHENSLH